MFGATQMPFYGKNNYYSPQIMYFRLLGLPLLGRRSSSWETRPKGGYSQLVYIYIYIYIYVYIYSVVKANVLLMLARANRPVELLARHMYMVLAPPPYIYVLLTIQRGGFFVLTLAVH